jgi:hypothetical protein
MGNEGRQHPFEVLDFHGHPDAPVEIDVEIVPLLRAIWTTDRSVTAVARFIEKDLRVTDNGDGTLTILVLSTGNGVVYGADGKAIARNPGQVRFEILVDHSGTPADPSDDEFLADLGEVKGSTGRTDDFCAAVVPALT